MLRFAVLHGALTPEVAADLARRGHRGGFSLHAAVLIEAADRPGLERLLRYCARPAFASDRLSWDGSNQHVRYRLTKPLPTGQTELALTPLELLDRLAALIPPPRRHRHHYAGVFAPPVLDAGFTCAFDQSPWWDSTPAAPEPSFHFDQTLNWPAPDHPALGSALRHAAGNGKVAAASSAPPSSLTPARPLQTPETAHSVAWITADRPGSLPERNPSTRTRAFR